MVQHCVVGCVHVDRHGRSSRTKHLSVIAFEAMIRRQIRYLPLGHNCLSPWTLPPPKLIFPAVRHVSTKPPSKSPPISSSQDANQPPHPETLSKSPQRFEKVFNRTPKFLRKWLQPIANKPLSHMTSFLILHEVRLGTQKLVNCRSQQ